MKRIWLALTILACLLVSNTIGRPRLGTVLLATGALVLGLFAALGAWAYLDFDALFALFHSFFFADGTWTFSADSLAVVLQ